MATKNSSKNQSMPKGYVSKGGADESENHRAVPAYLAPNPKVLRLRVHANNDPFNPGKKMIIVPQKIKTFENFLEECTQTLKKGVRRLYTPAGRRKISDINDLTEGGIYVATGYEPFKNCK